MPRGKQRKARKRARPAGGSGVYPGAHESMTVRDQSLKRDNAVDDYYQPRLEGFVARGPEVKYQDTNAPYAVQGVTATISQFGNPGQGVGVNARIGDEIDVLGIEMSVSAYAGSSVISSVFRFMVFQWAQDTAVVAAPLALQLVTNDVAALAPISPYNPTSVEGKKFGVIVDDRFIVSSGGPAGCFKRYFLRFKKPLRERFNAAAQTGMGTFWVYTVSDAAVNTPVFQWIGRILYRDV